MPTLNDEITELEGVLGEAHRDVMRQLKNRARLYKIPPFTDAQRAALAPDDLTIAELAYQYVLDESVGTWCKLVVYFATKLADARIRLVEGALNQKAQMITPVDLSESLRKTDTETVIARMREQLKGQDA